MKVGRPTCLLGVHAKDSKGRPQSPLVASAEAKPHAKNKTTQKSETKHGSNRKPPPNFSMRRACCAPLRPSMHQTKGSPERSKTPLAEESRGGSAPSGGVQGRRPGSPGGPGPGGGGGGRPPPPSPKAKPGASRGGNAPFCVREGGDFLWRMLGCRLGGSWSLRSMERISALGAGHGLCRMGR